jgi:bromodomain-containing factor 1
LTLDESRPKRIIKAPAKDLPEAPQPGRRKKTKKNIELNFCRSVLRELKKKTHWPYAYPFYEPVDDEKLGVPDYYKVIKRPMDLATINSKLENDQYANAEEFEEDIRLMFRNCYTYNGVGSEVYNMGKTLESVFNKKWAEKPVPQVKQKGKTKAARDDDTDTDSSSEEEFDEEEVSSKSYNVQFLIFQFIYLTFLERIVFLIRTKNKKNTKEAERVERIDKQS